MNKISVIMPAYNSENYIRNCLDSLLAQSFNDFEMIIVNDGSTDKTSSVLNEYQKKNPNKITIINKENGGQSSARNLGLKKSNSEYVIFLDSDDYFEKDLLSDLYNEAQKNKSDITICNYYFVDNEKKEQIINPDIKINESRLLTCNEYMLTPPAPWNKLFKREFLVKNNFLFPEGIVNEDYAVIPTLVKYKPIIYFVNKPLINYVMSINSTMRKKEFHNKLLDKFTATKILVTSLIDEKEYKDELEYLVLIHLLNNHAYLYYNYKRFDLINEISDYIKEYFPNWYKNKYLNNLPLKRKFYMYIFYNKKYKTLIFLQRCKNYILKRKEK